MTSFRYRCQTGDHLPRVIRLGKVCVHALPRSGSGTRQLPPRLDRVLPLPHLPVRVQQEEVRGLEEPAELGVLHPDRPFKRPQRRRHCRHRDPRDEIKRWQDLRRPGRHRHGRLLRRGCEAGRHNEQEITSRKKETVEVLLQGKAGGNSPHEERRSEASFQISAIFSICDQEEFPHQSECLQMFAACDRSAGEESSRGQEQAVPKGQF